MKEHKTALWDQYDYEGKVTSDSTFVLRLRQRDTSNNGAGVATAIAIVAAENENAVKVIFGLRLISFQSSSNKIAMK